ncbi:uncharacterized protein K452DRAFT_307904 [Aplosporella prunicola CBS 121167]|uniref:Uncharacterized protein n=1 Tax=Aplosporella prunicola CBS 121167 TaxID=1176127 RepID=A0A6A6BHU4_9PEZI|nr:uncharacterized protein K452DRAFT_307904 [Aplosporella prunicola CBS 121167]KAF2143023.1 hypothetical protein K452DRAFT_307904 [Aplosporella prunicola CBS 121167]
MAYGWESYGCEGANHGSWTWMSAERIRILNTAVSMSKMIVMSPVASVIRFHSQHGSLTDEVATWSQVTVLLICGNRSSRTLMALCFMDVTVTEAQSGYKQAVNLPSCNPSRHELASALRFQLILIVRGLVSNRTQCDWLVTSHVVYMQHAMKNNMQLS